MTDLRNREQERAIASSDTDAMYRRLAYLMRGIGEQGWPDTREEKWEVRQLRKLLGICERCGFSVDENMRFCVLSDGERIEWCLVLCATCRIDMNDGPDTMSFYGRVGHGHRLTDEVHWRHGGTMSRHWG